MCFNSPIMFDNARFASSKARCALRAIAECNALNHANASCGSMARKMHECMPSGEWSSIQRFSMVWKRNIIEHERRRRRRKKHIIKNDESIVCACRLCKCERKECEIFHILSIDSFNIKSYNFLHFNFWKTAFERIKAPIGRHSSISAPFCTKLHNNLLCERLAH